MGIEKHRVGMLMFIVSEAVFFIFLILTFVFYRDSPANRGQPTVYNSLDVGRTAIFTVCLWSSSLTVWLASRGLQRGNMVVGCGGLVLTILLGATFLYGEASEYADMVTVEGLTPHRDVFGSSFFVLTGFHGFHVFGGLVLLMILLGLAVAGAFKGGARMAAVECISLYWHFVDAVWVVIFPVVYLWSLVGR